MTHCENLCFVRLQIKRCQTCTWVSLSFYFFFAIISLCFHHHNSNSMHLVRGTMAITWKKCWNKLKFIEMEFDLMKSKGHNILWTWWTFYTKNISMATFQLRNNLAKKDMVSCNFNLIVRRTMYAHKMIGLCFWAILVNKVWRKCPFFNGWRIHEKKNRLFENNIVFHFE